MKRFKIHFKSFASIFILSSLIFGFYSKTIYSQEDPQQWLSMTEEDLRWEDEMVSVLLEKTEIRHEWPTEIFSVVRYKLPENHVFIVFDLSVLFKKPCEGKVSPGIRLFDNNGNECRLKLELNNRISDTKWSVKAIYQIHNQAEPSYIVLKYTWLSEENGDKKNGELQLNLAKKNS